jgi:hypothetical protein
VEWNRTSGDGKFVPESDESPTIEASAPKHRLLLSEEPIEAIWLRIRQLQSVTLAKKLIERRALADGVQLDEAVIQSKAEGVAYALRNASDYFQTKEGRNVSQRILNLYYGSLAFAFAEMLAAPKGTKTLSEIENSTKVGHGLYTLDGFGNGLEQIAVGVFAGFFPAWTASVGSSIGAIPPKKARRFEDLAAYAPASWVSVETLFASIPEVADLFSDIFEGKPMWVRPVYDQAANGGCLFSAGGSRLREVIYSSLTTRAGSQGRTLLCSRASSVRSRKLRQTVPAAISVWPSITPVKPTGRLFASIKVPSRLRHSFVLSSASSMNIAPLASRCCTRSRS